MFILCFYVPENHADKVKQACFDAGAGQIGNYDSCCWQTSGQGQFRPLAGSDPAIGDHGKLEQLTELKIEMVCEESVLADVVAQMKLAHPYEEVAYHVLATTQINSSGG